MAATEKKQHQGAVIVGRAELEGGAACVGMAELGLPYIDEIAEKAPPVLRIEVISR